MPRNRGHVKKVKVSKGTISAMDTVSRDIRALNSAILMISQKIKYITRNEKILGRNLIVLNKKVKEMADTGASRGGADTTQLGNVSTEVQTLTDKVDRFASTLSEIETSLETVKDTYAKDSSLKEIKYVVDSINPLEFVTYKDVEELIEQRMKAKKK